MTFKNFKKHIAAAITAILVLSLIPVLSLAAASEPGRTTSTGTEFVTSNTDPDLGPTVSMTKDENGYSYTFGIYANGFPLILTDSEVGYQSPSDAFVYWDKNNNGTLETGTDELVYKYINKASEPYKDEYTAYGGKETGTLTGDTHIVLIDFNDKNCYGGGGPGTTVDGDVNIHIKRVSGGNVYGGSQSGVVTGDVNIMMDATGTGLRALYGGGQNDVVNGKVNIEIKNGEVNNQIYFAGQNSTVGDILVNIDNIVAPNASMGTADASVTVKKNVVKGDVTINFKGGELSNITGIQNTEVQGSAVYNLSGGTVRNYIEGLHRNGSGTVGGTMTVNLSGDVAIGNSKGGGTGALRLATFTDRLVHITAPLTGAEPSIYVTGGNNGTPSDKDVIVDGAVQSDVKKFFLNYLSSAGKADLVLRNGDEIIVRVGYDMTIKGGSVYRVYPGDALPVLTPPVVSGAVFKGYFYSPTGMGTDYIQYYSADGTPTNATFDYAKDITIFPNWDYTDPSLAGGAYNVQGKVFQPRADIYKVDIGWGMMKFVYDKGKKAWDPQTHTYVYSNTAGWSGFEDGENNRITVQNHSNRQVNINLEVNELTTGIGTEWYEDQMLTSAKNEGNLPYCPEAATAADVPGLKRYLKLTGEPTALGENLDAFSKAGVITVWVKPPEAGTAVILTPDTGKTPTP